MNHLFQFRLSLILAQLLLLMVNLKWPIWSNVSHYLLAICLLYLLLIIVLQWLNCEQHQKAYMVLVDLLLWAVFFAFLDGVSNPLIWCLLIPTVLSSLSQSPSFTWLLTLCSNLVYLWLWYLGIHEAQHPGHGPMMANHIVGMWLGFIMVSLLLTWATTTLMNRIKAKNQSLIQLEQQRQADENILKMATLATSLAHELGTPLASINLLVSELRHGVEGSEAINDFNLLESQVKRCKKVLEELTMVADRSHPDDMRVTPVVDFINQLFSSSADQVSCHVNNQLNQQVYISVDDLFNLACLNVLNNSKAAGTTKIEVILSNDQTNVSMVFRDEGVGMAHKNRDGLGIGLKLSARIVSAMGGDLQFKAKSTGVETVIQLPIYTGKIT